MSPIRVIALILAALGAVLLLRLRFAADDPVPAPEMSTTKSTTRNGEPSSEEVPLTEVRPVASRVEESARVPAAIAPKAEPQDERAGWNVALVDSAGDPVEGADIDLVIVAELQGGMTQKLTVSGPTGEAGRVFVEDFPTTLPEEQRADFGAEGNQLWLVPAGLFGTKKKRRDAGLAPLGAKVTSGATSPPPDVTLVLPDSGAIRLTVRSPKGGFPAGFDVYLTEGWESLMDGSWQRRELPTGEAEAVLSFPTVGLNRQFEAEVKGASGSSLGKCSFDGPKTPGAIAEPVLELEFGSPRLRGRVLGVLDAPLNATLTHKPTLSHTLSRRRPQSMGEIEVDESGSFDVEAPWLSFHGERNVTLRLGAGNNPDKVFETILRVRPEEPIIELGEFTLDPLPVVIAGRVINQQGKGVATKLDMVFRRADAEGLDWDRFTQTLNSDDDGRFVHRGALPEGVIWLSIESSTHLLPGGEGTILEFPAGSDDVELVVSGQGWLTADASALPQSHLSHFFITAWEQGADEEVDKQTRQSFSVKNGPRFGPFTSGPLRVELQIWGLGKAASWDIVLKEGETFDLGALTTDQPLYAHTVIFDSDAEYMHDGPDVLGKTATRMIHGSKNSTGHRFTFLTLEPLESVTVQSRGVAHEDGTKHEVTGDETHIPWE